MQQFQETEAQLTQTLYETRNNSDNGASEATHPAAQPQSDCAESRSIQPLSLSSSQEPVRNDNSLRKGRKRKATTFARLPYGHHEIQNTHPTELPSPDYISWYVKDRLRGNITCMVCGEDGHYTCHCPMKDRENEVLCTLCNKVGHCYLWCCRQHVSENRACRRCGEIGHYTNKDLSHCDEKYTNMYVRCSSCDESHPLGRCPMGKVTCFLCEGKDHFPAQCRLKLCSETVPHDGGDECQFKRKNGQMACTVSSFSHSGQGHCHMKSAVRSVSDSDKTKHAALTHKALTQRSSSACFNCHEEGHSVNRCPKKKPGESERRDVTCFVCHEKGHYSYSCPKEKPPEGSELHDVTCINFDANRCDEGLELHDITCCTFDANRCDRDVTCFHCHDKGHYASRCPKKKINSENAMKRIKNKRMKDKLSAGSFHTSWCQGKDYMRQALPLQRAMQRGGCFEPRTYTWGDLTTAPGLYFNEWKEH